MPWIDLLVIGTSTDGLDAEAVLPTNIADAENTFGWYYKEWFTITSQQTSAMTTYPIWGGQIQAFQLVGNKLQKDPLYQLTPQASGTYVTFGSPGSSGTYLFKYITNPSSDNIVWALKNVVQQGSEPVYLYRIPGIRASIAIGDLNFQAEFSGIKYNDIIITVSGNYLTIYYTSDISSSGSFSYNITQSINNLVEKINSDHYFNYHPLLVTCYTQTPAIPSGTYLTSGGTNGVIDSTTIVTALSSLDINDIGTILIAGSPSTGVVLAALNYINSINDIIGPTCLIASSPDYTFNYSSNSFQSFLNSLNFNDHKLFYVPGWGISPTNTVPNTWFPLSYVFAGLWNSFSSAPTNKPTALNNITPYWNASQLHNLGLNYCVFNKFIVNNLSLWRSCPTNGESSLINKVKIDIAQRLSNTLEYLIGEPSITLNKVYDLVSQSLQNLDNIKEISYSCELDFETINIIVYVIPLGELQAIQFNISSKRPVNV